MLNMSNETKQNTDKVKDLIITIGTAINSFPDIERGVSYVINKYLDTEKEEVSKLFAMLSQLVQEKTGSEIIKLGFAFSPKVDGCGIIHPIYKLFETGKEKIVPKKNPTKEEIVRILDSLTLEELITIGCMVLVSSIMGEIQNAEMGA